MSYVLRDLDAWPDDWSDRMARAFAGTGGRDVVALVDDDPTLLEARKRGLRGRYTLRLGAFHAGELVGWTFGWQDSPQGFYMAVSGVLPEHRRKGLYRMLMEECVDTVREAGFHYVHSKHNACNTPILRAKLAAGFYLTGMSLHPSWGTMAHLERPLVEVRETALLTRAGWLPPREVE